MTMNMLGLGHKMPFPGTRDLRRAAAAAHAQRVRTAAQEATNSPVGAVPAMSLGSVSVIGTALRFRVAWL